MNILPKSAEDGKIHPTANKQNEAFVESIDTVGVPYRSLDDASKAAKQFLKDTISFRELVQSDGQQLKRSGNYFQCRCPFHKDRTPSFAIFPDDAWARCFGCDWAGDIFNYVMGRTGCSFPEAVMLLSAAPTLHDTKKKNSAPRSGASDKEGFRYSEKDLKNIDVFTSRVANEPWLAERIASVGAFKAETIARLGKEGSLGWAGDTLAFIYKTGYKLRRWPGRDFWWEVGHAHLWRCDRIAEATDICLCEGETDLIALLDKGIESIPDMAVVAAASATSFKPDFAPYFRGKHVTVCFDADEAGRKGAAEVHKILRPVAASLHDLNPKEIVK